MEQQVQGVTGEAGCSSRRASPISAATRAGGGEQPIGAADRAQREKSAQ